MKRRPREAAVLALCLGVAIVLTWPLVLVFGTRIGGDPGDPYQTLWGMRWIRDALLSLRNPFFTDRLFFPTGATLVFQTFDLPSALAMVPLWGLVPEVAIYNTAVLLALTITVYGTFRLVRDLTGDPAAAFATGVIFAAVPYQFAHLQGHLHLLAMGWLPLYLLHLLRVLDGRGRLADGVLGGVFLGLASLASWYHLLYALVLTPVVAVHALVVRPRSVLARPTLRALLALAATWLVMVGPLLGAMLLARAREPFTGAHDALTFSADLHAFVFPNAAQRWSGLFGAHWKRWSGNTTENAAYVGVTLAALALLGAAGHGRARAFVVAAVAGAVLALGPRLHVDGAVLATPLPYAYLERTLPLLRFTGVPIRFGYVMYLGLAVAAGFGLARLRRSVGVAAVVAATALVLVEYWPRPLITSDFGVPAPMRAWAADPTPFAVLDVWDWYRPMWHATIHRKPMVGGYLTRVPKRLEDALYQQPVVRAILEGGGARNVQRTDPALDFAWGDASPDGSLLPNGFTAHWTGSLVAPVAGTYELRLEADDAALLAIDGRAVLRRAGPCPPAGDCGAGAIIDLTAGIHALAVSYVHRGGAALVRLSWLPPGGARAVVPGAALRTAAGDPGLDAEYEQPVPGSSGLGRDGGRAALRGLGVRYVITSERANVCVEQELQLPLEYHGEGVRIFAVPGS